MKIADHIKSSLDSSDARELDKAMLFACLAIDGTAKKMYPVMQKVGDRFRKFIVERIIGDRLRFYVSKKIAE